MGQDERRSWAVEGTGGLAEPTLPAAPAVPFGLSPGLQDTV